MRQSPADFERAFHEVTREDRVHRERVRRKAIMRSHQRRIERTHKHGTARFVVLVLVLIATAVIVTVAMFKTLYVVMG